MKSPAAHPPHDQLNHLLHLAGISKTIYALVVPETERALSFVVDGTDRRAHLQPEGQGISPSRLLSDLEGIREAKYLSLFREAWTQKQDALHFSFFETWKRWSSPVVSVNWEDYPNSYPTAGASEALRERISVYGNEARHAGFMPKIHVFEGEYEGYEAFARANFIDVERHPRPQWDEVPNRMGATDQFYLSAPSAIDGDVWNDYDAFMEAMYAIRPSASVVLDLTYVGCVAENFSVRADHPNISSVVFSLSKPMGVYYHRIGGCLTRRESLGLFGNRWFKNLTSMALGEELMRRHPVHEIPARYKKTQQEACLMAASILDLDLKPCDVFLLGCCPMPPSPTPLQKYLARPIGSEGIVRACLTPTMAKLINPSLTASVRPRFYEGLES